MGFATSGGSAIGAVIAPLAIVWTVVRVGWWGAFLVTGAMGVLWLLLWLPTYSSPERSRLVTERERENVLQDREDAEP